MKNLTSKLGSFACVGFLLAQSAALNLACYAAPAATAAKPGAADASVGSNPYRLPVGAAPKSYKLSFTPDLTKNTFTGSETIAFTVSKQMDELVLNAVDLQLSAANLVQKTAPGVVVDKLGKATARKPAAYGPGKPRSEASTERVHIGFGKPLTPGDYEMKLTFKGILNDKLRGFYKSSYKDGSGKVHPIATTQMEPTDARRMFPCFDEPSYKATFQLTVEIDSDLTAVSNTKILSTNFDEKSNKSVITFAETPKMSTYLVALVVGPFESTQPVTAEGVTIRVWYAAGRGNLGNFARDNAAKLMTFYKDYFGVPYPEDKLDLVAIPDFQAGAMENLGCITFRENNLLVDTPTATLDSKIEVTSIIAHEMAHMWFGDVVTMKWWDDLWLNEAFATWMATKSVDAIRPEWHMWDDFAKDRAKSMETDELASTRAIHNTVANPEQAEEMFDDITYGKGASILRMLETFVSEDTFRNGVREYIKKHAFGNATTDDLWSAIGEASGKDVNALMKAWVHRAGFPVLDVAHPGEGKVALKQQRFYLIHKASDAEMATQIWDVPVMARNLGDDAHDTYQLTTKEGTMETGKIVVPFVANSNGAGYFRSKYSEDLLKSVQKSWDKLTPNERLGFTSDEWALAFSGATPISEYIDLTANYRTESDPNVVEQLIRSFKKMYDLVDDGDRDKVSALVRDRLGPIAKKLGWNAGATDTPQTTMLRSRVLEAMGTIGNDKETIEQAHKLFSAYVDDQHSLDQNLVDAVTGIAAHNGTEQDYELVKALWKRSKTPEAEKRNLMALGYFRTGSLASKTLNMCLTDEVRTQDGPRLICEMLRNPAAAEQTMAFLKSHWTQIAQRFNQTAISRIISSISMVKKTSEVNDFKTFMRTHQVPATQTAIARTTEKLYSNCHFYEKVVPELLPALGKLDSGKKS